MPYNLTNLMSNSTDVVGFVQGTNDMLMLGWGGTAFLIGFSVIILMAFFFSTGDVKKSIAATSFIAFGLTMFLRALNLVPNLALYIVVILCAAAVAITWRE